MKKIMSIGLLTLLLGSTAVQAKSNLIEEIEPIQSVQYLLSESYQNIPTNLMYIIEDENGSQVDTGVISVSNSISTRATWNSIALSSGNTLILYPAGTDGFYVRSGNTMCISYELNRSAKTNLSVKRDGTSLGSSNYTGSSVSDSYYIQTSGYHKVYIKNNDSSSVTISSVTVTF